MAASTTLCYADNPQVKDARDVLSEGTDLEVSIGWRNPKFFSGEAETRAKAVFICHGCDRYDEIAAAYPDAKVILKPTAKKSTAKKPAAKK